MMQYSIMMRADAEVSYFVKPAFFNLEVKWMFHGNVVAAG